MNVIIKLLINLYLGVYYNKNSVYLNYHSTALIIQITFARTYTLEMTSGTLKFIIDYQIRRNSHSLSIFCTTI